MSEPARNLAQRAPAARRLMALTDLDQAAIAALDERIARPRFAKRGRNIIVEGRPITEPILILEGWAARIRLFEDGRLQILSFLLPGDLIGNCAHPRPLAVSTVTALTDIAFCTAPMGQSPTLTEAYAVSRALEEAYLLANIARLGRLSAHERLIDLLLELAERLDLCGLMNQGRFAMPLTQQVLADSTGLTVVHVNRMISQLRRESLVSWHAGEITLLDAAALATHVGRTATRIQSHPV